MLVRLSLWRAAGRLLRAPSAYRLASSRVLLPGTKIRSDMANIQQVTVKCRPEDDNLIISILQDGRERHLDRLKLEPLQKALTRLQLNASGGKKLKKGSFQAAEKEIKAQLYATLGPESRSAISENMPNAEAWRIAAELHVGDEQYRVVFNPPSVDKIEVPGYPMVGYPLCPLVQLSFASDADCQWQWMRQPAQSSSSGSRRGSGSPVGTPRAVPWQKILGARHRVYSPTRDDIGANLLVECIPAAPSCTGPPLQLGEMASCAIGKVQAGPSETPGMGRHSLTETRLAAPAFRVVTYNILADQYASTNYADTVLFSYCPWEFRKPWYRRQLVLQELLGYHADVMCLQEVDAKAFDRYLQPHLRLQGYEGFYINKASKSTEGSATFFNRERWKLLTHQGIALNQVFAEVAAGGAAAQRHTQLLPLLHAPGTLAFDLSKVATTAQILLLGPIHPQDRPLCVINTHLFFHPRAAHIRTLLTAAIVVEAMAASNEMTASLAAMGQPAVQPALLFCGDFNSDQNDGMPGNLELLRQGKLPASHWDWQSGADFHFSAWEAEEAEGDGAAVVDSAPTVSPEPAADSTSLQAMEVDSPSSERHAHEASTSGHPPFLAVGLTLPCRLESADALQNRFTNYVRGYAGALDYVWYDPGRMRVRRQIPLPEESKLAGWIPSKRFPSDHLSVVFDMEWLPDSNSETEAASLDSNHRSHATIERGPLEDACESIEHHDSGTAPFDQGNVHDSMAASVMMLKPNAGSVTAVVECLQRDSVVALPTDTLYGLAACAASSDGLARIYAIKGRAAHIPLAVCVANVNDVVHYVECGHLPDGLLAALLPGPVTLLLTRKPSARLAVELNPGIATLGVRVPDSNFIRAVCRQHGGALALTSANTSGGMSSTDIAEFKHLWAACAAVVDQGRILAGREGSTIVDLSLAGQFSIVRPGTHEVQTRSMLSDQFHLLECCHRNGLAKASEPEVLGKLASSASACVDSLQSCTDQSKMS